MTAQEERLPDEQLAARLFPPGVSFVSATEGMYEAPLAPEEQAVVARAVESRTRSFRAGRAAARSALALLGVDASAVPVDENRRPVWPRGVVGTITHCDGYAAAAVAHAHEHGAVGLDAEVRRRVDERLAGAICTDAELREVAASSDLREWATVVFSAKEAGYKCLNPLADRFIGFHEAEVDVDRERAEVLVRMVDGPLEGIDLRGRYVLLDEVVLTAVTLTPVEARAVAARTRR